MNKLDLSIRQAERIWGKLQKRVRVALKQTIETYAVSVEAGDVQYIDGGCAALTVAHFAFGTTEQVLPFWRSLHDAAQTAFASSLARRAYPG